MTDQKQYYMVFAADMRMPAGTSYAGPAASAPRELVWETGALGVFFAETPELACQAAARKGGRAGTFFAIPGHPWGLEMQQVEGVTELGQDHGRPALGAGK